MANTFQYKYLDSEQSFKDLLTSGVQDPDVVAEALKEYEHLETDLSLNRANNKLTVEAAKLGGAIENGIGAAIGAMIGGLLIDWVRGRKRSPEECPAGMKRKDGVCHKVRASEIAETLEGRRCAKGKRRVQGVCRRKR